MALYPERAHEAVSALGAELGLDTIEMAEGIIDVINAKMAQAIRTLTVEQGIEPRDFALVAFGGAGPMHAMFLARELGISEVIVPRLPGAFSAWGMLETEIRRDFSRTFFRRAGAADLSELATLLSELELEGREALDAEGIPADACRVEHAIDMRYEAQEYTLTIPIDSADAPVAEGFLEEMTQRFNAAHDFRYGHSNPGAPVEFVAVRSAALGDLERLEPEAIRVGDGDARSRTYDVTFDRKRRETTVVDRQDLSAGATIPGPVIVEEGTATTVVPPGCTLTVDAFGFLIVSIGKDS
jgi:N-methylhydantoinase A